LIWLKPSVDGLVVAVEHVERADDMENGPKAVAE
jgi:hypothetical protein